MDNSILTPAEINQICRFLESVWGHWQNHLLREGLSDDDADRIVSKLEELAQA